MSDANTPFSLIVCEGKGSCEGGGQPSPPIEKFPLLVYSDGEVRTEDGKATVAEVIKHLGSISMIAGHFGTTEEHIDQAICYAWRSGLLR